MAAQVKPRLPIAVTFLLSLVSCSPGYVLRAAYEHGKILAARQPIKKVVDDPATPALERDKLKLVLEARDFAQTIGLDPGESFTQYTRIDRDVLAWVVLGSKPDSFKLHTWWFPIVGSVPYKGYFEKKDAEHAAGVLQLKGYETWVRGTEAFSTLGWFNDPVLSTTLDNDDTRIVNTVLHESVHSTVWIKNQVDFNESLANFIGGAGTRQFFEKKIKICAEGDAQCAALERDRLAKSAATFERELEIGAAIEKLYLELEKLYASDASYDDKLRERAVVFERSVGPLRRKYPTMSILKEINNAEIMQLKLYMTGLAGFGEVYADCGGSIACLMERAKKMEAARKSGADPFAALRETF